MILCGAGDAERGRHFTLLILDLRFYILGRVAELVFVPTVAGSFADVRV